MNDSGLPKKVHKLLDDFLTECTNNNLSSLVLLEIGEEDSYQYGIASNVESHSDPVFDFVKNNLGSTQIDEIVLSYLAEYDISPEKMH